MDGTGRQDAFSLYHSINHQPKTINQSAAVVEYTRHPSSKRNDAGGNPAGSAIARWCQSSPDSESGLSRLSWCESKSDSQFKCRSYNAECRMKSAQKFCILNSAF